jgi:hypothetical protein
MLMNSAKMTNASHGNFGVGAICEPFRREMDGKRRGALASAAAFWHWLWHKHTKIKSLFSTAMRGGGVIQALLLSLCARLPPLLSPFFWV